MVSGCLAIVGTLLLAIVAAYPFKVTFRLVERPGEARLGVGTVERASDLRTDGLLPLDSTV